MDNESPKIVQLSFGRCLAHGDLVQRFYDIFLESNPRVAPMFKHTDFEKQKGLLRHGLNLMIMFAKGDAAGQLGLQRLKKSHSKINLNIYPELYKYWQNSLIKAVSEFDRKFDDNIKNAWEEVISYGVDYIKSGYDEA
jgi:hemoglobin-like flavoprotein